MPKSASKLLNYADQTKTPIVNIQHCENFQPKGWLGTILASAKSCSTDYNAVLESLISLKINTNDLVLQRDEKNEPHRMQKHLFYGGSKIGNVFATYHQFESQIFLDGNWPIKNLSDRFHLEVSQNKSSEFRGLHIMLSYQWNHQKLVKQVADMLKQKNISIRFDITDDMKGNINTTMAKGVACAAIIVSFNTIAYSKSVNCQKELTYASQLKKNIVPVLLEDLQNFADTWLGKIIASLNKIHMQNEKQFKLSFNILIEQIYAILQENKNEDSHESQDLKVVLLREGRVSGQGSDKVGHFTIAGNYDNDGNVSFTKQYIEKHVVEYNGQLHVDNEGKFKIQ